MKKISVFLIVLLTLPLAAQWNKENINIKPEKDDSAYVLAYGDLGVSAKVVYSLPTGDIVNVFNAGIGPEVTLTYRKFLFKNLHLQLSGNYLSYTGKVYTTNYLNNTSVALLGRYEFQIASNPAVFFLQAGGGLTFEYLVAFGEVLNNIDALYTFGIGYETPVMKALTLQVGVNYFLNPQKAITGATRDGAFLNLAVGINYEFGYGKKDNTEDELADKSKNDIKGNAVREVKIKEIAVTKEAEEIVSPAESTETSSVTVTDTAGKVKIIKLIYKLKKAEDVTPEKNAPASAQYTMPGLDSYGRKSSSELEHYTTQGINSYGAKSSQLAYGNLGISAKAVYSMPMGDIVNVLNDGRGYEATLTYRKFLLKDFHLLLSGSYLPYNGKANAANNSLTNINVALLGRYDISTSLIPGTFFVQAGGGITFEYIKVIVARLDNIDALYTAGVGYEISLIKDLNLQAGINYNLNPEKTITGATRDGSFLNFAAGLNYELSFGRKDENYDELLKEGYKIKIENPKPLIVPVEKQAPKENEIVAPASSVPTSTSTTTVTDTDGKVKIIKRTKKLKKAAEVTPELEVNAAEITAAREVEVVISTTSDAPAGPSIITVTGADGKVTILKRIKKLKKTVDVTPESLGVK